MAVSTPVDVGSFYQRHRASVLGLGYFLIGMVLVSIGMNVQTGEVTLSPYAPLVVVGVLLTLDLVLWWRGGNLGFQLAMTAGAVALAAVYIGAGYLSQAMPTVGTVLALGVWFGIPVAVYALAREVSA